MNEGPSTVEHLGGFRGGGETEKKREGEPEELEGDSEEGEFEVSGPRRKKKEPTRRKTETKEFSKTTVMGSQRTF